jgi:trans-aconitate 2-methyltransferase
MAQKDWSSKQYLMFENERTRPVRDLLSPVPTQDARTVVDLGCGPGNSTEILAQRYPDAKTIGLDSSANMIAAARERLPNVEFDVANIETWSAPGPFDVILANAVFQWVPDHQAVLPALIKKLAPGGSLAVQMPDTLNEPAHNLMREIALDPRWAPKLEAAANERTPLNSADWYYRTLKPHCAKVDMWRTTYYHVLPGGAAAVAEWFKGTGLRPFLTRLDDTEQASYLEQYIEAVAQAYPAQPDGSVVLPFPRLFIVATR